MINKKDVLLLNQLIQKEGWLPIDEQCVFSTNHKDRLYKCLNKLETYRLIQRNGDKIKIDTFKGWFIGKVFIGFGVLKGDKDFREEDSIL